MTSNTKASRSRKMCSDVIIATPKNSEYLFVCRLDINFCRLFKVRAPSKFDLPIYDATFIALLWLIWLLTKLIVNVTRRLFINGLCRTRSCGTFLCKKGLLIIWARRSLLSIGLGHCIRSTICRKFFPRAYIHVLDRLEYDQNVRDTWIHFLTESLSH